MSDKHRWRYGETNPVVAAVDSTTVIEIGDLLWQDDYVAKPASMVNDEVLSLELGTSVVARPEQLQRLFANGFLGVAMQRSRNGDTAPIRVAATGVFEFECCLRRWELGDLVGAIPNDTGKLQDQAVGQVDSSRHAIGRVTKREGSAVSSVLVEIHSTVMTGGVEGSSREGV